MSIEQGKDISELFRRIGNLIRIGKVISVDYTKAKAKVKIGNLTTDYMPWLTPSTSAWIPLRNGEQVLVLSPNGDLRMGMILPALYQNTKSPPAHDSNKITFNVDVNHKGNVTATGNISTSGNITTTGKVTATGEVEGKGKKLSTHKHEFSYNAGETPSTATTEQPS